MILFLVLCCSLFLTTCSASQCPWDLWKGRTDGSCFLPLVSVPGYSTQWAERSLVRWDWNCSFQKASFVYHSSSVNLSMRHPRHHGKSDKHNNPLSSGPCLLEGETQTQILNRQVTHLVVTDNYTAYAADTKEGCTEKGISVAREVQSTFSDVLDSFLIPGIKYSVPTT